MSKSLTIASGGQFVYQLNRNLAVHEPSPIQRKGALPADAPARSAGTSPAVPGLSMAHNRPNKDDWTFKVCTDVVVKQRATGMGEVGWRRSSIKRKVGGSSGLS